MEYHNDIRKEYGPNPNEVSGYADILLLSILAIVILVVVILLILLLYIIAIIFQ